MSDEKFNGVIDSVTIVAIRRERKNLVNGLRRATFRRPPNPNSVWTGIYQIQHYAYSTSGQRLRSPLTRPTYNVGRHSTWPHRHHGRDSQPILMKSRATESVLCPTETGSQTTYPLARVICISDRVRPKRGTTVLSCRSQRFAPSTSTCELDITFLTMTPPAVDV